MVDPNTNNEKMLRIRPGVIDVIYRLKTCIRFNKSGKPIKRYEKAWGTSKSHEDDKNMHPKSQIRI